MKILFTFCVIASVAAIANAGQNPPASQSQPAPANQAVAQAHQHDHLAVALAQQPQSGGMHHGMMMMQNAEAVAEIPQLLARMNGATGDAKVAIMADLIARLVQRQTAMRMQMGQMQEHMMSHCQMMGGGSAGTGKPTDAPK
jgi:uncharacterized protein YqfA (UPF0365 family)